MSHSLEPNSSILYSTRLWNLHTASQRDIPRATTGARECLGYAVSKTPSPGVGHSGGGAALQQAGGRQPGTPDGEGGQR